MAFMLVSWFVSPKKKRRPRTAACASVAPRLGAVLEPPMLPLSVLGGVLVLLPGVVVLPLVAPGVLVVPPLVAPGVLVLLGVLLVEPPGVLPVVPALSAFGALMPWPPAAPPVPAGVASGVVLLALGALPLLSLPPGALLAPPS